MEVTEYVYDDVTGRVSRTVTTRESEWDEEQVDLLLGVKQLIADIGPHGQPMAEATDPQGSDNVRNKQPGGYHYRARIVATDHAAAALHREQQEHYKDESKAVHRETDIWVVEKVPDRLRPPAKR